MLVKQFAETVADLAKEIGCDGKGGFGSHGIPSRISVYCENNDEEYEFVGLEPSRLLGCGCWDGIILNIRKRDRE